MERITYNAASAVRKKFHLIVLQLRHHLEGPVDFIEREQVEVFHAVHRLKSILCQTVSAEI
jgi:hypothetical protein